MIIHAYLLCILEIIDGANSDVNINTRRKKKKIIFDSQSQENDSDVCQAVRFNTENSGKYTRKQLCSKLVK